MCCYDCLTKNSNLSVARKVELEEQQHLSHKNQNK